MGRRLSRGGRVAINIARDWAQDTTVARIAGRLIDENLDARIFEEVPRKGRSAVVVATKQTVETNDVAVVASSLSFREVLP